MKRIHSACMYQTLHFMLDPTVSPEEGRKKVIFEVKAYKDGINGKDAQLISEEKQADGSVLLEVRKRIGSYPVGKYFG